MESVFGVRINSLNQHLLFLNYRGKSFEEGGDIVKCFFNSFYLIDSRFIICVLYLKSHCTTSTRGILLKRVVSSTNLAVHVSGEYFHSVILDSWGDTQGFLCRDATRIRELVSYSTF